MELLRMCDMQSGLLDVIISAVCTWTVLSFLESVDFSCCHQ